MSSRFVRFDPETVRMLDLCMAKAERIAASLDTRSNLADIRNRLAAALIEAVVQGEKDEDRLVSFALRVLPAYRESVFGRA